MLNFYPVFLGSDANVYGMARSFYEAYRVTGAAICKRRLPATAHSRLVRIAVVEPRLEEDEVFVRTLVDFAKGQSRTLLLFSCADGYTVLLARHRAALAPYYRFACPPLQTVLALDDKARFYEICRAHGLHCPQTVRCTAENWPQARPPCGYPVVLKAADSPAYWNCRFPHKKKVFLACTEEEQRAILAAVYGSSYRGEMLLQEYIPGDDGCMRVVNAYCGRDGGVRMLAMGRPLLEEQTPEGIGNYAAILTGPQQNDAALLASLRAFLQAVGWAGFANFDLKQDPSTGRMLVFEMNPRQGRSSYYATAAGCNLARFAVEDLLLEQGSGCTVAEGKCLWLTAPYSVVRRYTEDQALLARAAALKRRGRCVRQLYCRQDAGPARLLWLLRSQLNYHRKMARWYGNKALRE